MDRRTFVLAGLGLVTSAAAARPRLETLRQWLDASKYEREVALPKCVERIRAMDSSIHAWVEVNPQQPTGSGSLSGVPFGVKDLFETEGLATEYGSPVYKGRKGTKDAAIVSEIRARGGVLIGKTHTAAFAWREPPPTRNPRNLAHTAGGSSSGSAAAVAAGMVPFAIGTQTGGSVIRPASFCGIAGFKTSVGLLSVEGLLPFAPSFDTVGFFTTTGADMLALWQALGHSIVRVERFAIGVPDPLPEVEPVMRKTFESAVSRLRRAGFSIQSVDIAATLGRLHAAQRLVGSYEAARLHEARYKEHGARLGLFADVIRDGLQVPRENYDSAMAYIADCKREFAKLFLANPIILTPAAPGPALLGLGSTGDSRMSTPWSALGVPAMTIPMLIPDGLPLGIQLIADHGHDGRLIGAAVHLEKMLATE